MTSEEDTKAESLPDPSADDLSESKLAVAADDRDLELALLAELLAGLLAAERADVVEALLLFADFAFKLTFRAEPMPREDFLAAAVRAPRALLFFLMCPPNWILLSSCG